MLFVFVDVQPAENKMAVAKVIIKNFFILFLSPNFFYPTNNPNKYLYGAIIIALAISIAIIIPTY